MNARIRAVKLLQRVFEVSSLQYEEIQSIMTGKATYSSKKRHNMTSTLKTSGVLHKQP